MVYYVAFELPNMSVNVNELASGWLHFLIYPVAVGDYYSGAICTSLMQETTFTSVCCLSMHVLISSYKYAVDINASV